jgi:hypothetical protein
MDLKSIIYEDDVIAIGLVTPRYEKAKEDVLCLAIRYLPPEPYHSKDGKLIKTTNNMGGATDWFVLPSSFGGPIGRKLIEQRAAGLQGFDEDGFSAMVRWLVGLDEIDDAVCY